MSDSSSKRHHSENVDDYFGSEDEEVFEYMDENGLGYLNDDVISFLESNHEVSESENNANASSATARVYKDTISANLSFYKSQLNEYKRMKHNMLSKKSSNGGRLSVDDTMLMDRYSEKISRLKKLILFEPLKGMSRDKRYDELIRLRSNIVAKKKRLQNRSEQLSEEDEEWMELLSNEIERIDSARSIV